MTARKISLLISDVDGTLVTKSKQLTPRAMEAVRALGRAGIAFAVTSSRPPRGMAMLVEPLALTTPLAGFNGGVFANPDMSVIEQHTLDPAVARRAVDTLLAQGVDAWVYTAREWCVRDRSAPLVAHEHDTIQWPPTVVADFAALPAGIAKIVGASNDHALLARCEATVQGALGGGASASRSQAYYLDITHPDANKGMVVGMLAKFLSFPTAEIAAIGDGANDIAMFRAAGLSIAMGNAAPEVKKEAQLATASNEEDGFALAVERYLLLGAA